MSGTLRPLFLGYRILSTVSRDCEIYICQFRILSQLYTTPGIISVFVFQLVSPVLLYRSTGIFPVSIAKDFK